jgi:hypothetical protein
VLVGEEPPGAAEAVDDLVHVQEDAVLLAEVRHRGQVVVGGGTATPTALITGSMIISATVWGPSPRIGGLHVLHAGQLAAGGLEAERAAVAVWRGHVHEVVAGERLELHLAVAHARPRPGWPGWCRGSRSTG